MFGAPLSLVPFWLVVMPIVYRLRRHGRLNAPIIIVLGAVVGVAVWNVFAWLFALLLDSSGGASLLRLSVSGAGIGMVLALFFALVAGLPWQVRRTS